MTEDPVDKVKPKVVVVMPAYNAAKTLADTWELIPKSVVDEVIVVDDASRSVRQGDSPRARLLAFRARAHRVTPLQPMPCPSQLSIRVSDAPHAQSPPPTACCSESSGMLAPCCALPTPRSRCGLHAGSPGVRSVSVLMLGRRFL